MWPILLQQWHGEHSEEKNSLSTKGAGEIGSPFTERVTRDLHLTLDAEVNPG